MLFVVRRFGCNLAAIAQERTYARPAEALLGLSGVTLFLDDVCRFSGEPQLVGRLRPVPAETSSGERERQAAVRSSGVPANSDVADGVGVPMRTGSSAKSRSILL